jgi:hypothetical protein
LAKLRLSQLLITGIALLRPSPGPLTRQRLLPIFELATLQLFARLALLCHALRLVAAHGLLAILKLAAFCLALLRCALLLFAHDDLLSLCGLLALARAALLGFCLAALVFVDLG